MKKAMALLFVLAPVVGSAAPVGPLSVYLVEPCRMLDTRGTGQLVAGEVYPVDSQAGSCGIPYGARALVVNITATGATGAGHLSALRPWGRVPANPATPTSILNYVAGQTVANAATVRLGNPASGWDETFWLVASAGVDVIIDVTGYVAP